MVCSSTANGFVLGLKDYRTLFYSTTMTSAFRNQACINDSSSTRPKKYENSSKREKKEKKRGEGGEDL